MIFPSRKRGAPDPYLDWKVRLFFLGAALALVGIGIESKVMVGLAIPVLLGAAALRFLPLGGDEVPSAEEEDGDDPSGHNF